MRGGSHSCAPPDSNPPARSEPFAPFEPLAPDTRARVMVDIGYRPPLDSRAAPRGPCTLACFRVCGCVCVCVCVRGRCAGLPGTFAFAAALAFMLAFAFAHASALAETLRACGFPAATAAAGMARARHMSC